jgi:hypothetical protein
MTNKNRSLGKLRAVNQSNPKAPRLVGKLTMLRSTLEAIIAQMKSAPHNETTCNLAGWFNQDREGVYLTVEISPCYRTLPIEDPWEQFCQQNEDEGDDQ